MFPAFSYAGSTVNYVYDNDGLLTGSGAYSISRNPENGLPEQIFGGALNLTRAFNDYGEVEGQEVNVGGQAAASWNLTRDNNGRIIQKTETIGGVPVEYSYTYDYNGTAADRHQRRHSDRRI